MIGEARTGSGFKGLASYLARGRDNNNPERVAWVEARNLPSTDMQLVPRLMRHTASLSKRVKKPAYHLSVSFPEQEQLGQSGMVEVADKLLKDLGLETHQAIILAHNDTAHPHMHLMINRVHPETGKAWSNSRDFARIEQSLRVIEQERGLQIVPGPHSGKERAQERGPTRGEYQRSQRENDAPLQEWSRGEIKGLKEQVAGHFFEAQGWPELEQRLAQNDLSLRSKGQGLIVTDGARYCKLSSLGKQVRLKDLENRFGASWKDYEAMREPAVVAEAKPTAREVEKPAKELTLAERRARNTEWLRQRQQELDNLPGNRRIREKNREHGRAPKGRDNVQQLLRLQDRISLFEGDRKAEREARQRRYAAHRELGQTDWKIAQEKVRIARGKLRFDKTLGQAFDDPGQARQVWEAHAAEWTLNELMAQGPEAMGPLRGFAFMGYKSKSRKKAERAFSRLMKVWQRQRHAEMRRENLARARAQQAGRWAAEHQRYRELGKKLGSRKQREQARQQLFEARAKQLRNVKERDIWEANIDHEQKQELARLWEERRVRDAERQAERERFTSAERRVDMRDTEADRERQEREREFEQTRQKEQEQTRKRDRDRGWEPF